METKIIQEDWVLITYDIPAKDKKLRNEFIRDAKQLGAIPHTDSVYLMPYSEKAMQLAAELAEKGHAVVWRSKQEDKQKAIEITTTYNSALSARCDYLEQRLQIGSQHIMAGNLKMALRMGVKTGKLLRELVEISTTYNPEWLGERIQQIMAKWKEVYSAYAE